MHFFARQWKQYLLVAAFFSLFINALQLIFPIYMLVIFDKVLASRSIPTLVTVSIGAILALIVMSILDFLRSRILIQVGLSIDSSLSKSVITQMIRNAVQVDSDAYREGIRDINILRNYFAGNAAFSFFDLPWMPVYLVVIFMMHSLLGWVAIFGTLVALVLGIAQEYLTGPRFALAKTIERRAGHMLSLSMRNAEAIVAMNMVPGVTAHWNKLYEHSLYLQTIANRFSATLASFSKSFRASVQIIVYGVAAYLVIENQATAGMMIAASIIIRQAMGPADQIMGTWRQTVDARSAYKRISELLQHGEVHDLMKLPEPTGLLHVEGVNFSINSRPILSNINFTLQAGDSMGLIGPSGAGKSSLCRLLLGIWKPASGKVRLDGADILSWNREDLGPYIGYLPQDVELFSGSVSDNIARLGEIDSAAVVQAAQLAGVHDMILRLPNGYDTQLGDRGQQISGGQRQLIGLARVFYGSPKFVILDEPNSNLDDSGERALLHALRSLKERNVTVIVITHKPSMLASVDKVMILKNGAVATFGAREDVFRVLSGSATVQ